MTENAQINQDVWKRIYKEGKGDLKYPNDLLVRLSNMLISKEGPSKILDFGFGTGANTLHFANMGHDVYGVEISPEALEKTAKKFEANNLKAQFKIFEVGSPIPYAAETFDVVVAWQVLYYNNWLSLAPVVQELERVMKKGGLFICAIAAPGDISQVHSKALGDSLYESLAPGQEGCEMIIPEKSELNRFFPNRKLEIGFFEYEFFNIHAKHYIITFRKD